MPKVNPTRAFSSLLRVVNGSELRCNGFNGGDASSGDIEPDIEVENILVMGFAVVITFFYELIGPL